MAKESAKGTGIWTVLAIPIMIWTVLPLLWMLSLSLKSAKDLANPRPRSWATSGPRTPPSTTTG